MKKVIFLASLLVLFIASSCSNYMDNEQINSSNEKISTANNGYEHFISTVDSINVKYASVGQSGTRGFLHYTITKKGEKVVDTGGSIVGGWVGKHFGTAVGASFGNPVTAALGYAAGRYVGRAVGGVLASYCCHVFACYAATKIFRAKAKDGILGFADTTMCYIPERNEPDKTDSIGYVHNKVMETLSSQTEKYISEAGINYDIIYRDCVNLLKEYGISNDTITTDTTFKEKVIQNAKDMAGLQNAVTDEDSYNAFRDSMIRQVKGCGAPDETVSLFSDYILKVSDVCEKLSDEQQVQYANELFKAIDKSWMTNEQKEEAASSTNVLINSSMYWNQEYTKDKTPE